MARKKQQRRRKGEGAYHYDAQTGRHRWRITQGGRSHEVSDTDPDRAKARFEDLKRQLNKDIDVDGGKQSLRTYMVDVYLPSLSHTVKATTLADYRKRAGYYILPTLGDYALRSLTRRIIAAWATAMLEYEDDGKRWSLHSIRQAIRLLQRCLDAALIEKLIEDNPAAAVKPPHRRQGDETRIDDDETGERALTPEQTAALLDEVKRTDRHQTPTAHYGTGMYVFYMVALKAGLRRGELLGLRWRDIDFEKNEIRVRQQVVRMDSRIAVTTPKSESARRTIPVSDEVMTLLKAHKLQVGARGREIVFPNEDGAYRQPNGVNQQFRRICQRIKLSGFTFHDLRRTAITRWREAGADDETIKALAGHSDVHVTLTVYSDPEARKRGIIEKVG